MQVPITSTLKLKVTSHSGRGVFAPPSPTSATMQPHSELSPWLHISKMGGPKERRCPAGDRPLNTSSVLLLHICQYHLSPRLPQSQSIRLHHSPAVLHNLNKLHLSFCWSTLWFWSCMMRAFINPRPWFVGFLCTRYRQRDAFANLPCLWQLVAQSELPAFTLCTCRAWVARWGSKADMLSDRKHWITGASDASPAPNSLPQGRKYTLFT